ncbi:DUF3618 domain-containing protein [Actinotalea subterranea]|uniref:DUF3618 domain-containing protein n=1 Tax=Actinotalea subterranea TaxID=2607497 RepID=UPI0011EF0B09|nr:DUF3618 domain-containing protein [Actinotalea subterranea]
MSGTTPAEIEAEIARTRAELKETVDELSERLDPRTQATHALDEAKIALAKVKQTVTGEVRSPDELEPTRTGWVVLGAGAALAAALVAGVVRKL